MKIQVFIYSCFYQIFNFFFFLYLKDFQEFLNSHSSQHFKPADGNSNIQKIISNFRQDNSNEDRKTEIIEILDELPNLSFMRAKVLTFPVKQI